VENINEDSHIETGIIEGNISAVKDHHRNLKG
jgi:hypothetical protein